MLLISSTVQILRHEDFTVLENFNLQYSCSSDFYTGDSLKNNNKILKNPSLVEQMSLYKLLLLKW